MMKKLMIAFFTLLLLGNPALLVSAAYGVPRLVEEADLLSDSDEASLLDQLD